MDVDRVIEKINRIRFTEKYKTPLKIAASVFVGMLLLTGFYYLATRW